MEQIERRRMGKREEVGYGRKGAKRRKRDKSTYPTNGLFFREFYPCQYFLSKKYRWPNGPWTRLAKTRPVRHWDGMTWLAQWAALCPPCC